jgi:hypothetical protein
MAGTKTNVAIWTAVIAAAATITAALITNRPHGSDGHDSGSSVSTTTTTSLENHPNGVVHVPEDMTAAYVYVVPVRDLTRDRLGELSDGQQVEIVCTKQGPPVQAVNGTSTLWDKIKYDSGYGYISDATVDTGTNASVAPSCPN